MLIRILITSALGHVSFKFAYALFIAGLQLSTFRVVCKISFFFPQILRIVNIFLSSLQSIC